MDISENNIEALHQRIRAIYETEISGFNAETHFQEACLSMLGRAHSLLNGVFVLKKSELIPESSILARSLVNLNWFFLFLVCANSTPQSMARA